MTDAIYDHRTRGIGSQCDVAIDTIVNSNNTFVGTALVGCYDEITCASGGDSGIRVVVTYADRICVEMHISRAIWCYGHW